MGMVGASCPCPFRTAGVLLTGRLPKVLILFETPRAPPGLVTTGDALGLRDGFGLAAGLSALLGLDPGKLLGAFHASESGTEVMRERCGLAVGRGDAEGRALFRLPALGEEAMPLAGAERTPGEVATPARATTATLPGCRGCALIAGREAAAAAPATGCARGLAEGRALGAGFATAGAPPACGVIRAGSVDLCADGGLPTQPTAAGALGGTAYPPALGGSGLLDEFGNGAVLALAPP